MRTMVIPPARYCEVVFMPSRRRRRFKGAVLWSVASLALIQLALSLLIETRLVSVRDPDYAFREARWRERLAERPKQTRIVFLGSSRIACGIDAERITQALDGDAVAFNFGIPRAGILGQRIYLERLHESGLVPDLVVIEVMVPFLHGKDVPFEDRGLEGGRFALDELQDVSLAHNLRGPFRKWLLSRSMPAQIHGEELRQCCGLDCIVPTPFLNREKRGLDAFGWRPSEPADDRQPELTKLAHRQYDEAYRTFSLHPEQVRRLEQLIARCHELGATPLLVLMPEGSEFRELLTTGAAPAIGKLLDDIRAQQGVRVIDARAWMADDAFIDMHHLHYFAARQFTDRLTSEAIRPLAQWKTFAAQRPPQ
jgi:hypothetical protein